jgi:phosphatidylserine/phosphatidylglycerophosphate/cardiolipin synthase-like enzyme
VNLLVQPEDGFEPVMHSIERAKKTIDTTIFRFDMPELQRAFELAVARGVQVRAIIAHTNSGGEKKLRKLETELLAAGVILARSDDDLVRYHGKMLVVDRRVLHVMLFNYTRLDVFKSRSFGLSTTNRRLVQEALRLFEADMTRQPYIPGRSDLVVSPETSRVRLGKFLKGARRELLIYDPRLTDPAMIRLLQERARGGVDVRVLGRLGKRGAARVQAGRLRSARLHARVIIRDGTRAFLGSQSLRKLELDDRREVGLFTRDPRTVKRLREVFEKDWEGSAGGDAREPPASRLAEEPRPDNAVEDDGGDDAAALE